MADHKTTQESTPGEVAKPAGSGLTRRELFHGVGAAALVGGVLTDGRRNSARAESNGGAKVLGPGPISIELHVNGQTRSLQIEPRTTLLDALRRGLQLTGAKPSCERGACGACTVLVDGRPIAACMMLALDAAGQAITTVEGLSQGDALSPLQQAFIEHDALQCGFCTPGMLMSCHAVLQRPGAVTLDDIKRGVAGNLCRCGTYPKVFSAALAAAAATRRG